MRPDDNLPDDDAELIAGAQAAASWVRARRATWTSTPLDAPAAAAPVPVTEPRLPTAAHAPHPPTAQPTPRIQPSIAARAAESIREHAPAAGRWLGRGAAAALVVVAAVAGARYLFNAVSTLRTREAAVVAPPAGAPAVGRRKPVGDLRVNSTPPGARVLVDDKARGVTPLAIADLSPGRHQVTIIGADGTVRRDVRIVAGETAVVEEAIFSGWATVYSPFEVAVVDNGRVLRLDGRNQVMLSAGVHELRVTNKALGYETVARVEIKPGESADVRLTPEPSRLTVTAAEPVDVWLDGARVGTTPLNGVTASLGTHEVVVRSATGAERRFTVSVGVAPVTLNVEF